MVAVGDVLGKFSSRKAAEKEAARLGYVKTKANVWRTDHLSASNQTLSDQQGGASMNQNKWQVYEQRKAELQRQHLSNKEYQDAIKRLADELGI